MHPPRRPTCAPHRTRLSALALAAALIGSLAACGSEPAMLKAEGPAVALTQKQAKAALLTAKDLGKFVASKSSDDDATGPGCLAYLDKGIAGVEPDVEAEANYEHRGRPGTPLVSSTVGSFDTNEHLADAMEELAEAMGDCGKVNGKDSNGLLYKLTVSTDNVRSTDDVDDQVNVRAIGTVTIKQRTLPFGYWVAVSRVGNNVAAIAVGDFAASSARLLDKFTSKAVDQLVAVAEGA